jgi:hypothetical protein
MLEKKLWKLKIDLEETIMKAYYRTMDYDEIRADIIWTIKKFLKIDCSKCSSSKDCPIPQRGFNEEFTGGCYEYKSETYNEWEILCEAQPPYIYYVERKDEIKVRETIVTIGYEGVLIDWMEYPPEIFITKYTINIR